MTTPFEALALAYAQCAYAQDLFGTHRRRILYAQRAYGSEQAGLLEAEPYVFHQQVERVRSRVERLEPLTGVVRSRLVMQRVNDEQTDANHVSSSDSPLKGVQQKAAPNPLSLPVYVHREPG